MFRALLLTKDGDRFAAGVQSLSDEALAEATPSADVTLEVAWSTLNYKDGLAITNRSPVVRRWPMVAGIDAAGRVLESRDPRFAPGDAVVVNGWGCGETQWGGLAERMRVPAGHVVRLPAGIDARVAMAIGTAGYTAMLCVMALDEAGVLAAGNEVLVTGANGGVGSVAIALLAGRGVRVVASTGRPQEADYLHGLGAAEIVDRAALAAPGKPLQKERWAGVVDAVGSHTLANACAQVRYGGAVAACGLAQGMDLPATVAPFILRGVRLLGVDSVMCPLPRREAAWAHLARELDPALLATMTREIALGEAVEVAAQLLAGQVRGRVVVDVRR